MSNRNELMIEIGVLQEEASDMEAEIDRLNVENRRLEERLRDERATRRDMRRQRNAYRAWCQEKHDDMWGAHRCIYHDRVGYVDKKHGILPYCHRHKKACPDCFMCPDSRRCREDGGDDDIPATSAPNSPQNPTGTRVGGVADHKTQAPRSGGHGKAVGDQRARQLHNEHETLRRKQEQAYGERIRKDRIAYGHHIRGDHEVAPAPTENGAAERMRLGQPRLITPDDVPGDEARRHPTGGSHGKAGGDYHPMFTSWYCPRCVRFWCVEIGGRVTYSKISVDKRVEKTCPECEKAGGDHEEGE